MYSKLINITPEMAKEMLTYSKGNPRFSKERQYNETAVKKYADDMKNGNWQITHQSIAFDTNGRLIDGHHRLRAIIVSGITVPMYVTYDMPAESIIMDCGLPRTTNNIIVNQLGVSKAAGSTNAVAIIRLHKYFECGENYNVSRAISNFEIAKFAQEHEESLSFTTKKQAIKSEGKYIIRNCSFGLTIFAAYECGLSQNTIVDFINVVASGFTASPKQYAAIIARNRLLTSKPSGFIDRAFDAKFYQNCLYDFELSIPRIKKYKNPVAVYTERMLNRGGKK